MPDPDTSLDLPWTHHRSQIASLTAHGAEPELIENARRNLRAARLADYIQKTVDAAPPLTDAQLSRLATLLRPTASAAGGDAA
jgi:hypothetical protein